MSHTFIRWMISLTLVVIVALAGCTTTAEPEPTATVALPPSATPVASAPEPTAPAGPSATPVADTPPPTAPPAGAAAPLVGPEWQVAYEGDLNQNGRRDVVAYKLSAVVPDASMQRYTQELPLTVSEAVIVQEGPQGAPQIQATVSPQGVSAEATPLIPSDRFGDPPPAAFLMGVNPQAEVPVDFIPLDANGAAHAQGFGLYWNEGALAYRLFTGGQAVPPAEGVPPGSTLPRSTPLPSETQAPGETEVVLYWVVGESLQPEYRRIPSTPAIGTATLEALLAGPQYPALSTAIPTPEEVQSYPGRQPDWGDRVRLLNLTIEDGIATANFSQEMHAYGGGSARVQLIREQITQTLLQFPTVNEVRIAVEGETEGVLQP